MEHAWGTGREGGAVLAGLEPLSAGLNPDHPDGGLPGEGREHPDRVRPAADAGHSRSGSRPSAAVHWRPVSVPITAWKSRTIVGYGCGPAAVPSR